MTAMRSLQQEFATGEMGFTMSICAAAIRQAECLKGVINGPDGPEIRLPLFPRKRTQVGHRFGAIRDILHCRIQHVIQSCGRRWHRGPYPRPIAEVSSGSAINITPEVIDHGHRPRPHRRCCSCLIISRGVTTGCAPGTPSIGPRWSGSIQRD